MRLERARNNPTWWCDRIEELIEQYNNEIEKMNNPSARRQLKIVVHDLENILYE